MDLSSLRSLEMTWCLPYVGWAVPTIFFLFLLTPACCFKPCWCLYPLLGFGGHGPPYGRTSTLRRTAMSFRPQGEIQPGRLPAQTSNVEAIQPLRDGIARDAVGTSRRHTRMPPTIHRISISPQSWFSHFQMARYPQAYSSLEAQTFFHIDHVAPHSGHFASRTGTPPVRLITAARYSRNPV